MICNCDYKVNCIKINCDYIMKMRERFFDTSETSAHISLSAKIRYVKNNVEYKTTTSHFL